LFSSFIFYLQKWIANARGRNTGEEIGHDVVKERSVFRQEAREVCVPQGVDEDAPFPVRDLLRLYKKTPKEVKHQIALKHQRRVAETGELQQRTSGFVPYASEWTSLFF